MFNFDYKLDRSVFGKTSMHEKEKLLEPGIENIKMLECLRYSVYGKKAFGPMDRTVYGIVKWDEE